MITNICHTSLLERWKESRIVAQNTLFNNIQKLRGDIAIMSSHGYMVDADTIKIAQALVREIKCLR